MTNSHNVQEQKTEVMYRGNQTHERRDAEKEPVLHCGRRDDNEGNKENVVVAVKLKASG